MSRPASVPRRFPCRALLIPCRALLTWILLSGVVACGKPSPGGLFGQLPEMAAAGRESSGPREDASSFVDASVSGDSAAESVDSGRDAEAPPALRDATAPRLPEPLDANPPAVQCSESEERCDGVDNDCDGEVDEEFVCLPECTGLVVNGVSYKYCAAGQTFEVAQAQCALDEMSLAQVDSEQTAEQLAGAIGALESPQGATDLDPQRPVRVGGSDAAEEGAWHWVDAAGQASSQTPFWQGGPEGAAVGGAYAPWAQGQPNDNDEQEDCLALLVYGGADGDSGQWNDVNCESPYYFLCQVLSEN